MELMMGAVIVTLLVFGFVIGDQNPTMAAGDSFVDDDDDDVVDDDECILVEASSVMYFQVDGMDNATMAGPILEPTNRRAKDDDDDDVILIAGRLNSRSRK
mmetsp:Transcript_16078/g.45051  ORF Transcript_16078/g.45051 Transcript_16078/m.45051 type:complete len:101 (+) Transcript_16078:2003-2305(+)